MLTAKENFLETLKKNGKPDRLVNQYKPHEIILCDPCIRFARSDREKGKTVKDRWGTTIAWPEDQHAPMPHVTADDKVLPDITKWRDYVKVPDLAGNATNWADALEMRDKTNRDEKLVMGFMGTGCFEQLHYLMGFEDTLMNFLLEPESMHELLEVICEYRLTYARLIVENIRPDIILSHDDWGGKEAMFISPEAWREFIKPLYAKIYGYIREQGILVMHHSDSFLEPIVEDMAEVGIDIWQGVLPTNDIPKLQKQLDGRMALQGGIDSWVDRNDSTEDEIRAETRRACQAYGPGGHFIPGLSYGLADSIFPHVDPIIADEIEKYNLEAYGVRDK